MEAYMKVSELLAKGWCQRAWALEKSGGVVSVNSQYAVSFCFVGAAARVFVRYADYDRFLQVASQIAGKSVVAWQDAQGRTQAEVVALAQRVEAELESR